MKLFVQSHLCHSTSPQFLTAQKLYPSMYGVNFTCLGGSTHTSLLDRVESKVFIFINATSLVDYLQPISRCHYFAVLALFYRCFHPSIILSERANGVPQLHPRPQYTRLLSLLYISLKQELLLPSSVTSGTHCLLWCFHLPMT